MFRKELGDTSSSYRISMMQRIHLINLQKTLLLNIRDGETFNGIFLSSIKRMYNYLHRDRVRIVDRTIVIYLQGSKKTDIIF